MIDHITFTGIDRLTSFDQVLEIYRRYPAVEFAVLLSSHAGKRNRFPGLGTICAWKSFAQKHEIPTAIHICGSYSRAVIRGNWPGILGLTKGFDRIQLNLPVAMRRSYNGVISRFTKEVPKLILQHETFWDDVPLRRPNLEYLFDRSGGRGVVGFPNWPEPDPRQRCGYAGGLGPDNIQMAVNYLRRFRTRHVWLDMESKIRNNGDWLDLAAVEKVCEIAFRGMELT